MLTDRSALPRRDREPDGAPESLVGRIDPREMGSRITREAPKDLDKKKKKAAFTDDSRPQRRRPETSAYGNHSNIIEATQDTEDLVYRPRTAETREVYELILSTVHRALGDQAQDIVRSAADTVLETLKDESMKDFDKKRDVEDVLATPISSEVFSQLISLSKKITDYGNEGQVVGDPDLDRKDAEIDDDIGVAVLFEDEDGDDDDEEEGFEILDGTDDEEPAGEAESMVEQDAALDTDELSFGLGSTSGPSKSSNIDKDRVSPHEIDGFWLQRLLSVSYPDPVTANDKTTSALSILSSESNLRDCENELMELFDFDKFDIVRILTKNRDVVVWCTKLSRSDEAERLNVEVAMREKGVSWILKELSGDRSKPSTGEAMDVDGPTQSSSRPQNLPATTNIQPNKTVDLEGMAFSQGGHLMSNKKVSLPEGSFKRSKKGYEEIHIPPPKPTSDPDERVPIDELPHWARPAFKGAKTLNRVQSKLYPMAFGSDEPILLCAPTGAGKVSESPLFKSLLRSSLLLDRLTLPC